MIKASELRIKNLVTLNEKQRKELWYDQINAKNDYFEVKTIYSDNDISIELDDEIIDISENDVEPILITEDWLLKFGFENKNGKNRFELEGNGAVLLSDNVCITIYDSYNEIDISVCLIKYVHQLQNLYFALTGAELTVA
jgi:hypothetical protein